MIVEVTQADIDNGKQECIESCPVSLAVNRVLEGRWMVVSSEAIRLGIPVIRVEFPEATRRWVLQYDATGTGEPFTFNIDYGDQNDDMSQWP